MQKLNFPDYTFRFKSKENKIQIFDPVRKKFFILQPEEWVRQHVMQYLIREKKCPISLVNAEKELKINGLSKRYDVVVYRPDGSIFLMVECKAPKIPITQETFNQIARYNMALNAEYLMVTNGMDHYYCRPDYQLEKYHFIEEIPTYIL